MINHTSNKFLKINTFRPRSLFCFILVFPTVDAISNFVTQQIPSFSQIAQKHLDCSPFFLVYLTELFSTCYQIGYHQENKTKQNAIYLPPSIFFKIYFSLPALLNSVFQTSSIMWYFLWNKLLTCLTLISRPGQYVLCHFLQKLPLIVQNCFPRICSLTSVPNSILPHGTLYLFLFH